MLDPKASAIPGQATGYGGEIRTPNIWFWRPSFCQLELHRNTWRKDGVIETLAISGSTCVQNKACIPSKTTFRKTGGGDRESNLRPTACKATALPDELHPQKQKTLEFEVQGSCILYVTEIYKRTPTHHSADGAV